MVGARCVGFAGFAVVGLGALGFAAGGVVATYGGWATSELVGEYVSGIVAVASRAPAAKTTHVAKNRFIIRAICKRFARAAHGLFR